MTAELPVDQASTSAPRRLPARAWLALLFCRWELPMWGRVYRWCVGYDDARWQSGSRRPVRGKLHGLEMELDLRNWSERLSWFLGRYHDLEVQMLLARALRPGEAFVDVGANQGMLSLLAAHLVGRAGRVLAFEPNPEAAAVLAAHLARNHLRQVELRQQGLSDAAGSARLRVFGAHSGWGSLSAAGPEAASASAEHEVPLVVGDHALAGLPDGSPTVVKIDVEGWELPVLRGLGGTLARLRPLLVVEVVPEHLQRAGSGADDLFAFLGGLGYRGFALRAHRTLLAYRLELLPREEADDAVPDLVFAHPDGPHFPRLQPLLRR